MISQNVIFRGFHVCWLGLTGDWFCRERRFLFLNEPLMSRRYSSRSLQVQIHEHSTAVQGNTLYLQIQIQRLISLILIIPVFEWAPDPLLLHLQVLVRFPHWHMLGNQTTRTLQVQIHGQKNTLYLQIHRLISSRLKISVFNGSLMSPRAITDSTK